MRFQKLILSVVFFAALGTFISSCNDTPEPFDYAGQLKKEVAAIDDYLAFSGGMIIKDPVGIRIVVTKLGTGLPAQLSSVIDVDYKGTLFADGSVFEDTKNTKGELAGYIDGWKYAFTQLPEGSEAVLYIPSVFAYGNVNKTGIPANSTLVFDVKFKKRTYSADWLNRLKSDTVAINQYLASKNPPIQSLRDSTGIRYVITQEGAGNAPLWYEKMKFSYSFRTLTNDTQVVIDLDREPSEEFFSRPVDYIQGMMIALHKMKVGSKATVYVPSGYGFGTNGAVDQYGQIVIPSNTNLIIDIELQQIQ